MADRQKPCVYGIRHPLNSWNPVWENLPGKYEFRGDVIKYYPATRLFNKPYTFVRFWVVTGLALMLQANQPILPGGFVLIVFCWLVTSVLVQSF